MLYCEICEKEYTENKYKNHLLSCIESTSPFNDRGDLRYIADLKTTENVPEIT